MEKIVKRLLAAIHAKCLDCVRTEAEVRACNWGKFCPLHPFRNGKLPGQTPANQTPADQKKGGKERG